MCDIVEAASGWDVFVRDPPKIHADVTAGFQVGFVATIDGRANGACMG